jgi:lincosamide nucleotidyltransferase A/C/D/E
MTAQEVVRVLDALQQAGCAVSLSGGWGVDALVGRQTRPHQDLDIDTAHETATLAALERLGYRIEADWRPNRVELTGPGGGRVDVHPLIFDAEGNGYQAGLDGERYQFPAASFVTGRVLGRPVRCLSAAQQVEWHAGYELRDVDRVDLAVLRELAREEQRPAIPAPPPDRRLANRDEALAARAELRQLAERHKATNPRVAPSGALVVGIPDEPGYATLRRLAADAAGVVGGWVNVVAAGTPWAPTTDTAPL